MNGAESFKESGAPPPAICEESQKTDFGGKGFANRKNAEIMNGAESFKESGAPPPAVRGKNRRTVFS